MRSGAHRALIVGWLAAGLAGSCSLGSLDELSANAGKDAGFDAVFEGPVEGGKCVPNQDCTGCENCKAWCACLSANQAEQCLQTCLGSGGGGGTGGVAGAGGGPTGGNAGDGGGGTGGSTTGGGGVVTTGGGGTAPTGGGGTPPTGGGGTPPTGGGGTTMGGGGSGGGVGIPCGLVVCTAGAQYCCADPPQQVECKLSGQGCTGSRVRCDGPEDCGQGQLCCGTLNGAQTQYNEVMCDNNCGSNERVFCHSTSQCATGTCQVDSLLPSYSTCK